MSINVLEKLARKALNGDDLTVAGKNMLSKGAITPTEHRSLQSLSWQIAANVQANGGPALGTYAIER